MYLTLNMFNIHLKSIVYIMVPMGNTFNLGLSGTQVSSSIGTCTCMYIVITAVMIASIQY